MASEGRTTIWQDYQTTEEKLTSMEHRISQISKQETRSQTDPSEDVTWLTGVP